MLYWLKLKKKKRKEERWRNTKEKRISNRGENWQLRRQHARMKTNEPWSFTHMWSFFPPLLVLHVLFSCGLKGKKSESGKRTCGHILQKATHLRETLFTAQMQYLMAKLPFKKKKKNSFFFFLFWGTHPNMLAPRNPSRGEKKQKQQLFFFFSLFWGTHTNMLARRHASRGLKNNNNNTFHS